tara:strand:+ start:2742 stop:3644 length:903 start_codon:yes stop_codon:yes gene_type:complete
MKKILVLATGWHFSSHFYENMSKQIIPDGWEVDYFCVAHREPEDKNTINEKERVRNKSCGNFLEDLDKRMYEYPITKKQIEDFGWKFMLEENTIGDMEVFNQWSDKYNYSDYDIICITHDDNFILSDKIFIDMLSEDLKLYKPIIDSRYGSNGHQFKTELVSNDNDWYFLDNGYTESIPKAFTPRGSFSFYKKELIDLLPNNKFNMYESGGRGIVTRVGKTNSVGHDGISAWNTHAGTFRDFLYDGLGDLSLVDKTRWFSNTKRVSKYCIEGERGFISNQNAGENYIHNLKIQLQEMGWI